MMTTDAVGGVWRYSVDAARALEARGITTTLASIGPDPLPEQRVEAAGLHLIATGLPLDWAGADRPALAAAANDLAQLADGYDVVQLNQPAFASLARFPAPVLAAAHSCVATWWDAVEQTAPLPPEFVPHAELTRDGLRAADATIAPTAAFAATLMARHGLKITPTAIHNGRAPEYAVAQGDAQSILGCGRLWDRGKNMGTIDAIAPLLGLPVYLYGSTHGPNGEKFTAAFAELHGHVPAATLARAMAARPIFVAPSLYEPFGLTVLEAAQAGCPLVLSDIPTFRELWDGAAIFASPRNPASWIAAISRARRERDELGPKARARAGRYTIDRMADRLAAVLRGLALRAAA